MRLLKRIKKYFLQITAYLRTFLAYLAVDFIPHVQRTQRLLSVNMDFSAPLWHHAAVSRGVIRGRAEGLIPYEIVPLRNRKYSIFPLGLLDLV